MIIVKKYDIFLFDADGTLFDYDLAEEYALSTMFKRCGFKYSDDIRAAYRRINTRAWESYERREITKDELQALRFSRLFDAIGVQYDVMEFNAMYLAELGKGTFLTEGAREICMAVTALGKRIFIVTNGILATQEARINHSLIKDYISGYFVSEHVGFQKPDAEYFGYVFSHIPAADKNKIIIIGDSLSADIAGGNNAGIDSCWYNPNGAENHTEVVPTYEINDLSQIRGFI